MSDEGERSEGEATEDKIQTGWRECDVVLKHKILCRLCRGYKCKRCSRTAYLRCSDVAFRKVHSNWITDEIVAMQRPSDRMIDDSDIALLDQFREHNITAIFNLTENGEHPWCGDKLLANGFSYTPERFMEAGVRYFNFSWKDLTAPDMPKAVSIVEIALAEIKAGGKVALHCHAGLGRTGLIAACLLMALDGDVPPSDAISRVRDKRRGTIQTPWQQQFVHDFKEGWVAHRAEEGERAKGATKDVVSSTDDGSVSCVSWDETRLSSAAVES